MMAHSTTTLHTYKDAYTASELEKGTRSQVIPFHRRIGIYFQKYHLKWPIIFLLVLGAMVLTALISAVITMALLRKAALWSYVIDMVQTEKGVIHLVSDRGNALLKFAVPRWNEILG